MTKGINFRAILWIVGIFLSLQGCGQAAITPEASPNDPIMQPLIQVTRSDTPTAGPIEVARPSPTATPPGGTALPTPPATYSGPLTAAQQDSLARAAQEFLVETPSLAERMAKQIGEETAASMDGPLVISMLNQAGLLPGPVNPHQLWLLDPVKDWPLAKKAFPKEDYQWITHTLPLDPGNGSLDALYTGDILYLATTSGALAQRFLLVTRVDEQGRAYSMTNLKAPSGGYVIEELLLYDPRRPQDGLPGDGSGAGLLNGGGVGNGRLLIWRLRDRRGESAFAARLDRVLDRGGKWNVMVKKVGGAVEFERDADAPIHPASVIKIPLAMLTMQQLEQDPLGLEKALETGPAGAGRSFEQLLGASLVKSEEQATGNLETYLFNDLGQAKIRSQLNAWGAPHTQIEPRRSTARDMAALLEGLYRQTLLAPRSSQILLNYLAAVTSGDTARLWKLNDLLPTGATIYNKRGTLTDPVLIAADAGIIQLPDGQAYILCLFGYPEGDGMETYEDLDAVIGDFAVAWYQAQFVESLQP